jgi:hypothetical protein
MTKETFDEIRRLFRNLSRAHAENAQSDNGSDVRMREDYYRRELTRNLAKQGCLCKIGMEDK